MPFTFIEKTKYDTCRLWLNYIIDYIHRTLSAENSKEIYNVSNIFINVAERLKLELNNL